MLVTPGTPAEAAGMRSGDQVISVNGQATEGWAVMLETIQREVAAGRALELEVWRDDPEGASSAMEELFVQVVAEPVTMPDYGVQLAAARMTLKAGSLGEAVSMGFGATKRFLVDVWLQLKKMLFSSEISTKNLGGIISIASSRSTRPVRASPSSSSSSRSEHQPGDPEPAPDPHPRRRPPAVPPHRGDQGVPGLGAHLRLQPGRRARDDHVAHGLRHVPGHRALVHPAALTHVRPARTGRHGAGGRDGPPDPGALFPSAIGDLVVGIALAHLAAWPATPAPWLILASLGVYHGAMALNDWADRASHAPRTDPLGRDPRGPRPLRRAGPARGRPPVGRRRRAAAGIWMGAVALLAVLYDLVGRGPVLGPLLLGLCRAGNLGAGLLSPWLVGGPEAPRLELLCGALRIPRFFISRLGRLEDEEDDGPLGDRPTRALRGVTITRLMVPVVGLAVLGPTIGGGVPSPPLALGLIVSAGLVARGATGTLRLTREGAAEGWTRQSVGRATGQCLRGLPTYTGAMAAVGAFLGPPASRARVGARRAWISGRCGAPAHLTRP